MTSTAGMIVDVVDDQNRLLGQALRGEVLRKGLGFRTVHIFLFDPCGKLLLQELPLDHLRSPGKLGSSVAGYLWAGESYADAAARKMRQELSIDTPIWHVGTWRMTDIASPKFVGLFVGLTSQVPVFDPDEIADIVFMDTRTVASELRRARSHFTQTFAFAYERFRDVR